jgi:hypothetical protein
LVQIHVIASGYLYKNFIYNNISANNFFRIAVANPEHLHLYETLLFHTLKQFRFKNGELDGRLIHLQSKYIVKYKKSKNKNSTEQEEKQGEFFSL